MQLGKEAASEVRKQYPIIETSTSRSTSRRLATASSPRRRLLVSIPVALGVLALIALVLNTPIWQTVAITRFTLGLKLRKWSSGAGFFWATFGWCD